MIANRRRKVLMTILVLCVLFGGKSNVAAFIPSQQFRRSLVSGCNPMQENNKDHLTKSKTCSSLEVMKLRGGNTSGRGGGPPSLSRWIVPALSSALSYALYNLSIKLAAPGIHPMLGGVILQFVAVVLGSILLVLQPNRNYFEVTKPGVLWSVSAGLAVGAAEILSFCVSARGAPASQSVPVMIGGSVALGSVLGALVLREHLSWRGWLGVGLVVVGIACVATDPASSMGH